MTTLGTQHNRLSQAAHDRLTAELADLTTRGRIDIAHKIEAARELGDLSENGDYHAAREEQGLMEARILQLEQVLSHVEILNKDNRSDGPGVVVTGSVVEIRWDGSDSTERYLVGSIEEQSDSIPIVSERSPMGRTILGAAAGQEVKFTSPRGPMKVTVVSVK